MNLGVRFDRTAIGADAATAPAHPLVPELFPALTTPAVKDTHVFNVVVPRVGVSYALGEERKSVVRASYSQFASQLNLNDAGLVSGPLYYSYFYSYAIDGLVDGVRNHVVDAGEILPGPPVGVSGFDPENPTSTDSPNRVGSNLRTPRTHEVLIGFDQELLQDMAIRTALTYRRINGTRWQPLIGIRQSDFEEAGRATGMLPDGGTFDQPFFAPKPGVVLPAGNGREDINREGYYQRFWGLEVNARKRLSENWMMRLGFSSNSHVEFFTDPSQAIEDPTPMVFDPQLGGQRWHSPQRNGGSVIKVTEGSGKRDIFLAVPKYQFVANGMYQGPWGVNVGVSLIGRQGFPQPFYAQTRGVPDPVMPTKKVVVVDDVGANRLPAVTTLDFRIEKTFTVDQTNFIITADVFNVGNASTVLRRQYDVATTGNTGSGKTLEIMNPRVARIGLRITF